MTSDHQMLKCPLCGSEMDQLAEAYVCLSADNLEHKNHPSLIRWNNHENAYWKFDGQWWTDQEIVIVCRNVAFL